MTGAFDGNTGLARGTDPLRWARKPKTALTVEMMVAGSRTNPPLRDLLRQHVANEGADCRTDEARRALFRHAAAFRVAKPARQPGEDDE